MAVFNFGSSNALKRRGRRQRRAVPVREPGPMQEFDQPVDPHPVRIARPRLFDDGPLWWSCIGIAILCFGMAVAMVTVTWKASFGPLLVFLVVPFGLISLCYPIADFRRRIRFFEAMHTPVEGPDGEQW